MAPDTIRRSVVVLPRTENAEPSLVTKSLLQDRRRKVRTLIEQTEHAVGSQSEAAWLTRTYPVMSVLAPAQRSHEGKIEYPGDPMCLYGAVSIAIGEVQKAKLWNLGPNDPYNDLCPQWGTLPSLSYRERSESTIREMSTALPNTDESVFDPRVWNKEVKTYFIDLLAMRKPAVVLISSVSCAHRYALDIAKTAKEALPSCLVVLGGRHADETMRYSHSTGSIELGASATFRVAAEGKAADSVDFVLSGECYWSIDLLLKAISIAMDVESKVATVGETLEVLRELPPSMTNVPGRSVIGARLPDSLVFMPILGRQFDMAEVPAPYQAFAIRAKFPIFQRQDGTVQRTAHLLTTTACPYRCSFCSEGIGVVGRLIKVRTDAVRHVANQIIETVNLGAEAAFFDDSIMFAGQVEQIRQFSRYMADLRDAAIGAIEIPALSDPPARARLANFQWGAQLTGEFLSSLRTEEEALALLSDMKHGGCTYIYFGLESLADEVINHVHKNRLKLGGPSWEEKIRTALRAVQKSRLRAGTAVLFGLEGETRATIDYTIDGVARLIDSGLIEIASPSILTYHPGTEITRLHGMEDHLDYHSIDLENKPPYLYFEQAFPGVVSKLLSENDIWHIHHQAKRRWGSTRNDSPMVPTVLPNAGVN